MHACTVPTTRLSSCRLRVHHSIRPLSVAIDMPIAGPRNDPTSQRRDADGIRDGSPWSALGHMPKVSLSDPNNGPKELVLLLLPRCYSPSSFVVYTETVNIALDRRTCLPNHALDDHAEMHNLRYTHRLPPYKVDSALFVEETSNAHRIVPS